MESKWKKPWEASVTQEQEAHLTGSLVTGGGDCMDQHLVADDCPVLVNILSAIRLVVPCRRKSQVKEGVYSQHWVSCCTSVTSQMPQHIMSDDSTSVLDALLYDLYVFASK